MLTWATRPGRTQPLRASLTFVVIAAAGILIAGGLGVGGQLLIQAAGG